MASLHAQFGRDAAHAEWFYGFRLAIKTDLGSRIVRACAIMPAAVNQRDVATGLLAAGRPPRDLLRDKGFNGKAFAVEQAAARAACEPAPTYTSPVDGPRLHRRTRHRPAQLIAPTAPGIWGRVLLRVLTCPLTRALT
jgi:hypothetical protein